MSVVSGQSITKLFRTGSFTTGAATNADSTPTGTVYVNGTADAATVTVTNVTTGLYKAAVTLPTLAISDIVDLVISASVGAVADKAIIWTDTKDADSTAGVVNANVTQLLGTAWLAPDTAGTPDVNAKFWNSLTTVALPLIPTTAGRTIDVDTEGEVRLQDGSFTSTVLGSSAVDVIVDGVWDEARGTHTTGGTFGALGVSDGVILANDAVNETTMATSGVDEIVAGVWDRMASAHSTGGTFGEKLQNAVQTTGSVVDAVWDELAADHVGAGSFGKNLDVPVSSVSGGGGISVADIWNAATSGLSMSGSIGKRLADDIDATISSRATPTNITAATGITVSAIGANVITATSIAADAITDAKVASDVTIASVTGAVGSVTGLTASNLDATISSRMATYTQPTGFLAASFPTTVASTTNITAGTLTTVTTATNVTTVNGLAANVITAAAIADGAIDAATFAAGAINAAAIAADAITDAKVASDVTIASVTGAVGSVTAAITLPTIPTAWITADGIETDAFGALEIAAGAASEIATAVRTELTTELGRIDVASSTLATAANLATIDDFLDTEIAAIKAKTDNLPSDPADQSAVESAITAATSPLATSANLQIVDDLVDDLESRLTASRAGYLDNLNVGGAVASQADINALNQSASRRVLLVTVPQYERPESGTNSYTIEARTFDGDGAAANADSTPTLTATGIVSGSLAANLSAVSNPATGVYRWTYSQPAAAALEQIRMDLSATITAVAYTLSAYTQSADFVSTTWTTTDSSNLTAIYNKLPSRAYITGTTASTGAPLEADLPLLNTINTTIGSAGAGLTVLATQASVNDLPTNAELATALAAADDAVLTAVATRSSQTSVDDLPTNAELATAVTTVTVTGVDAATANKLADHARRRTQANVEASANGDALSLGSEYGAIQQAQEANYITGVVKKTDGSTTLGTLTIATTADAEPIRGVS